MDALWEDDDDEVVGAAVMGVAEYLRNRGEREDPDDRLPVDMDWWRELRNSTFKKHFRMNRVVFQRLVVAVGTHLMNAGRIHRSRTPLDFCIQMALWPVFNQDTFRSTGILFGRDRSTIHFHYRYVIEVLRDLAPKYIKWPSPIERDIIKYAFEEKYGYPGVVGLMDGVHIEITAPVDQPQRYINRHGNHSILVQAVCDHRMVYRDLYVGEVGSIGDRRMFNRSPLSNNILLREDMFDDGEHILADGAYELNERVIIPYVDGGNLTPRQRTHNRILSSSRAGIERSFARMRSKNRRTKKLPMRNIYYTVDHITASFVLHNFILLDGHEIDGLDPQEMPVVDHDRLLQLTVQSQAQGALKREYIAYMLHP